MDKEAIGRLIKERRKKLGLDQQDLADLAMVGINTVVAIERGQGNPQLETLLSIAEVLGLQIDLRLKD